MRVLEYGLRALAGDLNVQFLQAIELQQWQTIIEKIEAEIRDAEQLKKRSAESEPVSASLSGYTARGIEYQGSEVTTASWRDYPIATFHDPPREIDVIFTGRAAHSNLMTLIGYFAVAVALRWF